MPDCRKDPMRNIPTLSSYNFGYICDRTSVAMFNSHGHIPIELKIKDIEFDIAAPIQNKVMLRAQVSSNGRFPYINAKLTMPLKITIDTINFRHDISSINYLHKDLKNYVEELVKPVNGMWNNDSYAHVFEKPPGFGFDVQHWITLDTSTGKFCKWESMEVDTAINADEDAPLRSRCEIVKRFRLVLQQIDGKKLDPNMDDKELDHIVGELWQCECHSCYDESDS